MKIALIGSGKIGSVLIKRLIASGFIHKDNMLACDVDEARLKELRERLGIMVSMDNKEGARFGDIILIAVLPKQVREVLQGISPEIDETKTVVSVAGLFATRKIEDILAKKVGVVRIMPNIPSLVGSGFNLISFGRFVKDREVIRKMLATWGEYREIDEDEDKMELYQIITAMGPTYFFPFLDVLISFGTENGLSEREAREAACLTLMGTGDIALKVQRSVEDLKNMIGSRPIKDKEEYLRSMLREALSKTLRELMELRERI